MAAVASVTRVSDPYTNAVLGDYRWASGNLSYSFPATAASYEASYGSNEPSRYFGALNATQQNAARAAFANYAAVANVTFSELTGSNAGSATLRLAMSDAPGTAWAYLPSTAAEGGDVWFNQTKGYYNNPVRGNYAYTIFLHEIGHALGLEHPHENGMPVDRDSMEFTVMSYRSYVGASTTSGYTNESWGYAQTLMMYDIAAIQHLYGANFSTNSGNTTYSWSPATGQMSINGVGQGAAGGNKVFQTVWDGGGSDTYDFSNYTTDQSIDLRPGQWTTTSAAQLAQLHYNGSQVADGNIANALQYNGDERSLIENAVGGSGNDTITGNEAANQLFGGAGDDVMRGGAGDDVMRGGVGDDVYEVTDTGDQVIENAGAGRDTVWTSVDHALSPNVEILYLAGEAVRGRGNSLGNIIDASYSTAPGTVLTGGGGADVLVGGRGADSFVFELLSDSAPTARDSIRNFQSGMDRVDLRGIDANSSLAGDQAFSYVGASPFAGTAGELNFVNGVLSCDVNGDSLADLEIDMLDAPVLVWNDFYL